MLFAIYNLKPLRQNNSYSFWSVLACVGDIEDKSFESIRLSSFCDIDCLDSRFFEIPHDSIECKIIFIISSPCDIITDNFD